MTDQTPPTPTAPASDQPAKQGSPTAQRRYTGGPDYARALRVLMAARDVTLEQLLPLADLVDLGPHALRSLVTDSAAWGDPDPDGRLMTQVLDLLNVRDPMVLHTLAHGVAMSCPTRAADFATDRTVRAMQELACPPLDVDRQRAKLVGGRPDTRGYRG